MKPPNIKQLIPSGRKIGKLTVLKCLYQHDINTKRMLYLCRCDCGTEKNFPSSSLSGKKSKSCGCAIKEGIIKRRKNKTASEYTARSLWKANYSDGCSFEKFLELSQMNCYYCGSSPSNHCNAVTRKSSSIEWHSQGYFTYNGLDRIDSNQNHNESNVVPCCKICNWMKNKFSIDVFLTHIKRICHHLKL